MSKPNHSRELAQWHDDNTVPASSETPVETVELARACEREWHRVDSSVLNGLSYLIAGAFLWWLLHGLFNGMWSGDAVIPEAQWRVKDILNVAMYVVPYCFFALALRHGVVAIFSLLQAGYLHYQMQRLKRRMP
ncbi:MULTISPECIES: hypothetical protein [Providencia]|uniref:hypothetical protein n=1 Tax=Providencia TaxID=586 RepID=UPI001120EA63|nr:MULTISPECIES: hypothetical protein [Providencia]